MNRTVNKKIRKLKKALTFSNIALYALTLAVAAFTAIPIVYMVSTAFKPLDELLLFPPRYLVRKPTVKNFSDLVMVLGGSTVPFTRYLFNSVITVIPAVALSVIICSMGAYALSKCGLPGANAIFTVVIAALMFSPHVTQIPTYMVIQRLGLLNTYWALIFPKIAIAYNFFLMKQFIDQFPDALIEAAKIDGAKHNQLFWSIVMVNLKPAWSTLIVFSFVTNWNDYFTPLIYIRKQAMKTLPLAMQSIGASGSIGRAGAMAAATLVVTAPTIVIFLIMQRKVMETMIHSGIKA